MKLFKIVAIVFSILLLQACQLNADDSIIEVVKNAKPAVVTIITYEGDKETGQGTGFFTNADTILTNYHVIEGASKACIRTVIGETYDVKEITASDPVADVALLKLSKPVNDIKPLILSKILPQEGEKIVVVGSPYGLEQTVSDGIISAIRDIPSMGKHLQISAPISPGSSGSPVLNLKSEVIGIVVATLEKGQNLNFAVCSEYVLSLKSTGAMQLGKLEQGTQDSIWMDIRKGAEFSLKGEYTKALEYYNQAIKSSEKEGKKTGQLAIAYYLKAGVSGINKKWHEAVTCYQQAIEINPKWAEAHNWLGYAYHNLEQYEKEVECLKTALKLKPDYFLAQYGLALAYEKMGNIEECINAFKQTIRIRPEDANAHNSLGIMYRRQSKYADAVDEFLTAIRLKSEDADIYYNLAGAYTQQTKFEEAFEAYKQAVRINPDFTDAHAQLAIFYVIVLEDKASALDEYKIIKKLDPQLAEKIFNMIYK